MLLRGAHQNGKSSAVRNLDKQFKYFAQVNFERTKSVATFFKGDINVKLISGKISNLIRVPIHPSETLLFLDKIQTCSEAIMTLRFFKEDYPELHVIAAGSLPEFAIQDLPTFGVGRIRSLFMYSMTFDEFLAAMNMERFLDIHKTSNSINSIDKPFHDMLIEQFRIYMMIGGMTEAVITWKTTNYFMQCQRVHKDIILTYEDDFNKYSNRIQVPTYFASPYVVYAIK